MSRKLRIGLIAAVFAVVFVLVVIPRNATSFDTRMTVASTFFAAVAAVAGVLALYYASVTIRDSESAARQAWARHREQIDEMRAATQAEAEQHRVEMEDRRRVAAIDGLERRLRQLNVVTEMVLQVGNVARDAARDSLDASVRVPSYSQIPSMLITLESAVAVLAALGLPGTPKTVELTRVGRHLGTRLEAVATMSVDALFELQQLALDVPRRQLQEADPPVPPSQ